MKLKNLFLTSLVALALGACSSSDDTAVNNNAEGNATFAFQIAMPAGTTASGRADSYSTSGTQVGSNSENALQSVAVSIKYTTAGVASVEKYFTRDQFNTNTTTDGKYVIYTLTDKIEVAPGVATIYATVNGGTDANKMVALDATQSVTYAGALDGLTNGIAKDNNFLMSGKTVNPVTINEGSDANSARIVVSRVAAKIQEATTAKTFTIPAATTNDQAVVFTPRDYTLLNLNNVTNVFEQTTAAAATGYFQAWVSQSNNNFDYIGKPNKAMSTTSTYVLENDNTTNPTKVVYAVKVKLGDNAEGTDLYQRKGDSKLYTATQLNAAFNNIYSETWKLTDDNTYEQWLAAGIIKYEDGVCYYVKDIKTVGTDAAAAKIVRNNWYVLNINSISGIGSPVVDPKTPTDPTLLQLEVAVSPWVMNANNFDL